MLNIFCDISRNKVFGPFFINGNTITSILYLQMIKNRLYPQILADGDDFILQQMGHTRTKKQTYPTNNLCKLLNVLPVEKIYLIVTTVYLKNHNLLHTILHGIYT